jgi:hypothetical protein
VALETSPRLRLAIVKILDGAWHGGPNFFENCRDDFFKIFEDNFREILKKKSICFWGYKKIWILDFTCRRAQSRP